MQLLRKDLIGFGRFSAIRWPQISVSRRHSIAGGLLSLEAAFEVLNIDKLHTSDYALREGALVITDAIESTPAGGPGKRP